MVSENQTIPPRLGNLLKEIRNSLGLKQAEMAAKLGVSGASQSYYENNLSVPDAHYLTALSDMGFDLSSLMSHGKIKTSTNEINPSLMRQAHTQAMNWLAQEGLIPSEESLWELATATYYDLLNERATSRDRMRVVWDKAKQKANESN